MKKIVVLMSFLGFALILQSCAIYPYGHPGGHGGYGSPYYGYQPNQNFGGGRHHGWGGHHGWGDGHGHH